MYIVYSTSIFFQDEYIVCETKEEALKEYERLLSLSSIYTAGYAKIIESTDHE